MTGYAFRAGVTTGEDFITLPPANVRPKTSQPTLSITTDSIQVLINRLHDYCEKRSAAAIQSGKGADHTRRAWWLSRWTAKQQVAMAVDIMTHLYQNDTPNVAALQILRTKDGPHKSGKLHPIFAEVMQFVDDYSRLQAFNEWVKHAAERRATRAHTDIPVVKKLTG